MVTTAVAHKQWSEHLLPGCLIGDTAEEFGRGICSGVHVLMNSNYYSVFQMFRQSGFQNLSNQYIFSFHKCFGYRTNEYMTIVWIFPDFLSQVLLMIFMKIKCEYDFIIGKKNMSFNFEVVMTYIQLTRNSCSKEQPIAYVMYSIQTELS